MSKTGCAPGTSSPSASASDKSPAFITLSHQSALAPAGPSRNSAMPTPIGDLDSTRAARRSFTTAQGQAGSPSHQGSDKAIYPDPVQRRLTGGDEGLGSRATFHDLRHHYAYQLLQHGESVKV